MFSKISRYRTLPDVVTGDAKGRVLASTSLRPTPPVSGEVLHTLAEGERLDHLAETYYRQPRTWWRICDANPAFLSPLALLGHAPSTTTQFPLTWTGTEPPWSGLLQTLTETLGVEAAQAGTPELPAPALTYHDGPAAFSLNLALTLDLNTSTRNQALTQPLNNALLAEGVSVSADIHLTKLGPSAWRLIDRANGAVHAFRLTGKNTTTLTVHPSMPKHAWVVTVAYNAADVTAEALHTVIQNEGFVPSPPMTLGRIGKPIVIPPDAVF